MSNTESYFYGQGKVEAAPIIGGKVGQYRWIHDVSAMSITLAIEKVEHKESYSGQKSLVRSFPVGKSATLNMTLHSVHPDNLALVLYGKPIITAAGVVTDEALPDGLADGDTHRLAHMGISNLTLKTATGGAIAATKYQLEDNGTYGEIRLLDTAGLAQPLKASYQFAAQKEVGLFTAAQPVVAIRYKGVNLAEGNAPVLVELYKVATDPLTELALITDGTEVAGMPVTGGILLDSSRPATGALGQFGHIGQLG